MTSKWNVISRSVFIDKNSTKKSLKFLCMEISDNGVHEKKLQFLCSGRLIKF